MTLQEAPLVSVLIPVFNRERLIVPCLESALRQTVEDIEIIVVDNNSTDRTWDVVRAFAERDRRIRPFRNSQNVGPVQNWMRCVAEARGRYTKILFSDDLIAPDYLEKALELITKGPSVGFVFSVTRNGKNWRDAVTNDDWKPASGIYSSNDFVHALLFKDALPTSPGAALFRTEDVRKNLMLDIPVPGFDFASYGAGPDVLLYLLTAEDYSDVGFIKEPLTFFRSHDESITVENKDHQVFDAYCAIFLWYAEARLIHRSWVRLLARNWAKECVRHRKWIPVTAFSKKYSRRGHEGSPALFARWALATLAWLVSNKIRKVYRGRIRTMRTYFGGLEN